MFVPYGLAKRGWIVLLTAKYRHKLELYFIGIKGYSFFPTSINTADFLLVRHGFLTWPGPVSYAV